MSPFSSRTLEPVDRSIQLKTLSCFRGTAPKRTAQLKLQFTTNEAECHGFSVKRSSHSLQVRPPERREEEESRQSRRTHWPESISVLFSRVPRQTYSCQIGNCKIVRNLRGKGCPQKVNGRFQRSKRNARRLKGRQGRLERHTPFFGIDNEWIFSLITQSNGDDMASTGVEKLGTACRGSSWSSLNNGKPKLNADNYAYAMAA